MTLKREIKDAYIEGGASIYVKTHGDAVYVDENETETLTQRLDNVKDSITEHTSQLNDMVKKSQVVNNSNTTEEGFIADARQLKTLNDKIELLKIAKIYPTFTNGVANYTIEGIKTSSMVLATLNHEIAASIKCIAPAENNLKIVLDSTTITGPVSLTILYKL